MGVCQVCVCVGLCWYLCYLVFLCATDYSTWPNLLCRLQTQDSMILLRIEYRRQSTGHAISIARCSLTVFTAQSQLSERYCMPRFEDIFITLSRCARALWCDASISITAQYSLVTDSAYQMIKSMHNSAIESKLCTLQQS